MKKIINYLIVLLAMVSTSVFAGQKTIFFEQREIKDFQNVNLSAPIRVIITMGDTESLRLEGDAERIADVITEVKEGTLSIKTKTDKSWNRKSRDKQVTAYLTAKNINSLVVSGAGAVKVENELKNEAFSTKLSGASSLSMLKLDSKQVRVEASGAGSMKIGGELNAQEFLVDLSGAGSLSIPKLGVKQIRMELSGAGKLDLKGNATEADLRMSGAGSFEGTDFSIDSLLAEVSGAGKAHVTANKTISATVTGAGVLHYRGNATISNQKTSGAGRIVKDN